jgi:tetratricopeptide (TPR) repeat protein
MLDKQTKFRILLLALLLSIVGSACTPTMLETIFDKQAKARVAIYEKNNGRKPTQALLLARIAVGYAKLGQEEKASKLLIPALVTAKSNNSFDTRTELWKELGVIYIEMGQYDKALEVAKSLEVYHPSIRDIELKHIAIQMAEARQYDKALQITKLISKDVVFLGSPTVVEIISQPTAMAEVALRYAQVGQKGKAEQMLAQALQLVKTNNEQGYEQKNKQMAEVALRYTQIGQKDKAEQILAQALQLAKSDEQMAEVALRYAQIGQKDKAEQILAQVSQNAKDVKELHDLSVIVLVAVKYREMRQQSKAEQLLAQAFQETKKIKGSQDYFSNNNYSLTGPDYYLSEIAIGYAKIGQCNRAINIAKSIEGFTDPKEYSGSVIHDGIFTEIAENCAEADRFDLALRAIKEIKWAETRRAALADLAVRYAESDRFDLALLTIDNIKETGDTSSALAQLAIYYGTVGQYERAFQLLKEIDSEHYKIEALVKIVEQATQEKSSAKVEQVLLQALEIVKITKVEASEKAALLTAIAIEYAKLGQKDKTEQLLAQALKIAEYVPQ